uniref:Predicted protein n=1 Tax=Hordeum vulgare subsp. vulgare TaxID=112509 RepID=F2DAJ8_HORVV|nr:predicted protein [Hordeum vulgare subsp. vulgare]
MKLLLSFFLSSNSNSPLCLASWICILCYYYRYFPSSKAITAAASREKCYHFFFWEIIAFISVIFSPLFSHFSSRCADAPSKQMHQCLCDVLPVSNKTHYGSVTRRVYVCAKINLN